MKCRVNQYSSRVCELGTKSCEIEHNSMNTEQTLASAENQLERDEEARSCEHEYQRISVSTAEDGTQFSNCVCLHCNDLKQFEI